MYGHSRTGETVRTIREFYRNLALFADTLVSCGRPRRVLSAVALDDARIRLSHICESLLDEPPVAGLAGDGPGRPRSAFASSDAPLARSWDRPISTLRITAR